MRDQSSRDATCRRCGDPLPVDGRCDCAGDEDRDYLTGHRDLQPHEMPVRLGAKTQERSFGDDFWEIGEVWV